MKTPLFRVMALLLLASASLVVWVGVRTIQASRDLTVRQGLDYRAFLDALDELTTGPGDSTLLVFHPVDASLPGGLRVTFDTLSILADTTALPAFSRAGFLHDQVLAYNRFQRERLALAREFPQWFQRLRAFNPSVFRSYRRSDGSLGLTRASSAWSLRVRSPLEAGWTGQVLSGDVHRGQGLLSPKVAVPLRKPIRLQREVEGRLQRCDFKPSLLEVRAFCLSEAPIPQAIFRLASDGSVGGSWAVAGWDDLWVDGQRIRAGDSIGIPGGTLLRLNPLEPVVFTELWEGVLSSRQWVNGRMQRIAAVPPPLDLFGPLGGDPVPARAGGSTGAHISLTVQAEQSVEISRRLEAFLEREVDLPVDFGTIVLARISDGAIVAVAEVGERSTRGRSPLLERVSPGSAVKPLLAAAILSERPELARLRIPPRSGAITSVMGLPAVSSRRAFSTALNCPIQRDQLVDLRYFLRCSNNEFAASLLVAGLEPTLPGTGGAAGPGLDVVKGQIARETLLESALTRGMQTLFDLATDPTIVDTRERSQRNWEGLTFHDGTPVELPWGILPDESRPVLLADGSSTGTELGLLYRYAFGAWENRWTLLDLTNGFGRVVTDRRLQLRFHAPGPDSPEIQALGLRDGPWYPEFQAGLRGVAVDGTAFGLEQAWAREGLPSLVLAKTGTLAETGEPGARDDLFSKSLLFAVGEGAPGDVPILECGLVGGIYIRFARGPESGSLPSHQVEFAREEMGRFLAEHWEALGACPRGG